MNRPMNQNDEIEARLWEYVYELLSVEEARDVEAQITSDPRTARLYTRVKMQADLVAEAARCPAPTISLSPTGDEEANVSPAAKKPAKPAKATAAAPSLARAASAIVAIAAALLVCATAYTYVRSDSPLNQRAFRNARQRISAEHPRVIVTGTTRIDSQLTNVFSVAATGADGSALSTQLRYQVYDASDNLKLDRLAETDSGGRGQFELPGSLVSAGSRLLVSAGPSAEPVLETELDVALSRFVTQLSTDKPLYRPGETVRYRSLTLSRFGLRADGELGVQFEILDPSGAPIAESKAAGATDRGVGNGEFVISPDRPGGKYTLVARSMFGEFAEQKREFFVRGYRPPQLTKDLELLRDSYSPGDEVLADFSAARREGGASGGKPVKISAIVDGATVHEQETVTDASGALRIKFRLPETIERGAGVLAVSITDGQMETITETIPINLGKVDVDFFPESGDLAAGLENRVYFHAYDPLGKPVDVEGRIVDSAGSQVATVKTGYEGRGRFQFTPQAEETYSLEITSPKSVTSKPALPAAKDDAWLVLDTGAGVFAPGDALEFTVRSTRPAAPLVVSAVCRGAPVGQQSLLPEAAAAERQVTLPLAERAEGVIRLTVYDYGQDSPRPIAERLVYRRPARKLRVEADEPSGAYSPGEHVKMSLKVSDETGEAAAGAVLGVAVVDNALLNLADDKSPRLATHYYLATEIEKPEDLEDANFYLSGDAEAEEALDLLLGVQGWRRFAEMTISELALASAAPAGENEPENEALARLASTDLPASPPLVVDNYIKAQAAFNAELAALAAERQEALNAAGKWVLFGAAAVLVVLTLVGLLRLASSAAVWAPSLCAAAACLLIGWLWMGARVDPGRGAVAVTPFSSFGVLERQIASVAESRPESTSFAVDGRRFWGIEQQQGGQNQAWEFYWDKQNSPENLFFDRYAVGDDFGLAGPVQDFDANINFAKRPGEFDDNGRIGVRFRRRANADFLDRKVKNDAGLEEAARELKLLADKQAAVGGKYAAFGALFALRDQLQQATAAGDKSRALHTAAQLEALWEQHRFPVRIYAHQHTPAENANLRTDFTEVLYWNPLLVADESGRASLEFDLSDSVTTFRLLADAHGGGRIGSVEADVVSRIPFRLEPKLPLEVTAGDVIEAPVAVNNDTEQALEVELALAPGDLLTAIEGDGALARKLNLGAGQRVRQFFALEVTGDKGEAELEFRGQAGALSDQVRKTIKVVPSGFPVDQSFAGAIEGQQQLTVKLPENWVAGSLEVSLKAFPSSLAELQQGVEGMLREPGGCFEQTSSSNYPNLLALDYMQEHDVADPAFTRRAKDMLGRGYGKLVGFECKQKGYEWFGGDPGHEALTAYGLMEFRDMSRVWEVDQQMVERTARWLLDRRNGEGGFQRNAKALDSFGQAPQDITDAYIVWALTESGQQDIDAEVEHAASLAKASDDPYLVALAAASAANASRDDARELLDKLAGLQQEDGRLEAKSGTITRSGGLSMQVETTALAALAWLKNEAFTEQANKAVQWITDNRQGGGGFGSTQATILGLKALIEHAKANRKTVTGGALVLVSDGREIGRQAFIAGENHPIELDGIAGQLKPGENELAISLTGDNQMPYVLDVSYRSLKPASDEECAVRIATQLAEQQVSEGDTVGLTVEVDNQSGQGQPMTVAIVGLPAGLEPRPKQLEELQEAGRYDLYEIRGRELIFYWRSLSPEATGEAKKSVELDLVAAIPGRYSGPASRAYLYYTAEQKQWADPLKIEILAPKQ